MEYFSVHNVRAKPPVEDPNEFEQNFESFDPLDLDEEHEAIYGNRNPIFVPTPYVIHLQNGEVRMFYLNYLQKLFVVMECPRSW
jgi:hypothetical protein